MIVRKNLVKVTAKRVYEGMGSPPQVMYHHVAEYCRQRLVALNLRYGIEKVSACKTVSGYEIELPAGAHRTYHAVIGLAHVVLGHVEGFLLQEYLKDSSFVDEEARLFARQLLLVDSSLLAEAFFGEQEETLREQVRLVEVPYEWVVEELGMEIRKLKRCMPFAFLASQ